MRQKNCEKSWSIFDHYDAGIFISEKLNSTDIFYLNTHSGAWSPLETVWTVWNTCAYPG